MTTSSSPIAPPQALVQGVSQTNQAIPQIDSAVAALLALPPASGTTLANLPADVSKACSDAAQWNTTYRAQVISALQMVVDWNATFNGFYSQLQALATQMVAGEVAAVAPFQSILQQLQAATQGLAASTGAVSKQLVSYETLISGDIATLNGDQASLQATQKSDQETEQAAQQRLQSLESQQQQQQRLYHRIQGIPIYGRYLAALEEALQVLSGNIANQRAATNAAQATLNSANAAAKAAGQAATDTATANTDLGAIASGVGALDQGWNVLDSNFNELISSESITTYNVFTPALLQATQADWNNLAGQAASLLPATAQAA